MAEKAEELLSIAPRQQDLIQQSCLLALPTELRLIIYSYLWSKTSEPIRVLIISDDADDCFWTLNRHSLGNAAALMLTCRELNAEVHRFVYDSTQFDVEVRNYWKLTILPRSHGPKNFLRLARRIKLKFSYQAALSVDWLLLTLRSMFDLLDTNERLMVFDLEVTTPCVRVDWHHAIMTELMEAKKEQAMLEAADGEEAHKIYCAGKLLSFMEKLLL